MPHTSFCLQRPNPHPRDAENAQGAFYNTATYLTGPRGPECRIDDTQQTEGYYNPADASPRPVHSRGVTKWYVYDGLGSVVGEMDFNGNLTSSPKYDVYGGVRSNSGTASSKMGFVGGLGHLSEATTGLIYMKARYYDPNIGRFSSEDSKQDGSNWFVYVRNNPITGLDKTGNIEGEDDEDEADGEAYGFMRGQISRFLKSKSYSSARMIKIICDLTGCSEDEAGSAIHAAKDAMGGAANNRNPDIMIDAEGNLFAPGAKGAAGEWLGNVLDFM